MGSFSPLVETPFLFSFGIRERKDQETIKISGYSIPVCLWKKDGRTKSKKKQTFSILSIKFKIFVTIIFQENMVKMKLPVFLTFSIKKQIE